MPMVWESPVPIKSGLAEALAVYRVYNICLSKKRALLDLDSVDV